MKIKFSISAYDLGKFKSGEIVEMVSDKYHSATVIIECDISDVAYYDHVKVKRL